MSEIRSPKLKIEETETDELSVIDGELVEDSQPTNQHLLKTEKGKSSSDLANKEQKIKGKEQVARVDELNRQSAIRHYLLLPLMLLTVTLLGGLRLSGDVNAFIFLKPA